MFKIKNFLFHPNKHHFAAHSLFRFLPLRARTSLRSSSSTRTQRSRTRHASASSPTSSPLFTRLSRAQTAALRQLRLLLPLLLLLRLLFRCLLRCWFALETKGKGAEKKKKNRAVSVGEKRQHWIQLAALRRWQMSKKIRLQMISMKENSWSKCNIENGFFHYCILSKELKWIIRFFLKGYEDCWVSKALLAMTRVQKQNSFLSFSYFFRTSFSDLLWQWNTFYTEWNWLLWRACKFNYLRYHWWKLIISRQYVLRMAFAGVNEHHRFSSIHWRLCIFQLFMLENATIGESVEEIVSYSFKSCIF